MNLFNKIIGSFVLVGILPLVIFGFLLVNKIFDITKENSFENNLYASDQVSSEINTYFITIERFLKSIASYSEIIEFNKEAADWLLSSSKKNYTIYHGDKAFESDPFESFLILDSSGKVQTVYPSEEKHIGMDYSKENSFKEVIGTEDTYFSSNIVDSEFTSQPVIRIAVPILKENGEISSVLVADVNIKSIGDMVAQTKIGKQGYVYVIDKEGTIIAHPNQKLVLDGQNIEDVNSGLSSEFKEDSSKKIILYPKNDPDNLIAYSFSEMSGWTAIAQQSLEDVLADPLSVKNQFIIIISFIIIVLIFLALYFFWGITRPLKKLTKWANKIGDNPGHEEEIEIKTGDEIEELTSVFNGMIMRLGDETLELQERTIELEKKTIELDGKRKELEKFYNLTVGRELKMIELKERVKKLEIEND